MSDENKESFEAYKETAKKNCELLEVVATRRPLAFKLKDISEFVTIKEQAK